MRVKILQIDPETVKLKDKDGKTSLYLAANEGCVPIAQLLLRYGSNILFLFCLS